MNSDTKMFKINKKTAEICNFVILFPYGQHPTSKMRQK